MLQLRQIRHETGKNVVCLRSDTINSADAPYINRIMRRTLRLTPRIISSKLTVSKERMN